MNLAISPVIVILAFAALSRQDITVISPAALATEITNHKDSSATEGNLEHSIATFGHIDYRKHEIYQVVRAS